MQTVWIQEHTDISYSSSDLFHVVPPPPTHTLSYDIIYFSCQQCLMIFGVLGYMQIHRVTAP